MNIFDEQFDFLKQAASCDNGDNAEWIADNCIMEWPFFSWQGREAVQKALQQLNNYCSVPLLIFNGMDKSSGKGTFLYKLTQAQRPVLWCGIWLTIDRDKVQNIRFIFDSFEFFKDNKTIEIFGFQKVLASASNDTSTPDNNQENPDKETTIIVDALRKFFLKKYEISLQDTPIARRRLYQAAQNAKNQLKSNDKYTVILPFFSANQIGPIQFFATIIKTVSSYDVV